jgi:repressor LexA
MDDHGSRLACRSSRTPRQLVGDGALFLLRVHGESMINAAIADGDLVVVPAMTPPSSAR